MSDQTFRLLVGLCALVFLVFFCFVVVPPLIDNPDVPAAFAAGFVNPFASGYSADVIVCWALLAIWIVFEARRYSVRGGWVCLMLGVIPGVAVGFAVYLIIRSRQLVVESAET